MREEMLNGMTVLLAEDNPTNQMVAVQMLETLGAQVVVADDGVEAIATLAALGEGAGVRFDLLLIDIEMPRKNGIEVIRAVRSGGGRHADAPIIALTAYVMSEHRRAIDAAGADGVIAKPIVSIEEFGREILRHSKSRRSQPVEAAATEPEGAIRAAPARGSTDAVLDEATLRALSEAVGAAAFREIIFTAEADLRATVAALSDAVEREDANGAGRAAHILAGLAGTVGATSLSIAVATMRAAAAEGAEPLPDAAQRTTRETERTLEALSRLISGGLPS